MRRASPVPWSIALLGLAYGLTLIGRGGAIDGGSLLVAGWLFITAELGYLALEAGPTPRWPWRRPLAALAIAVGSSLAGILLLAVSQSAVGGSLLLTAGGIAAALTLLVLLSASLTAGA